MRTQQRWTLKTTFAGDREPHHEHFAYEYWGAPDDARDKALALAKRRYADMMKDLSFEVSKVEIYHELMAYTISPPVETYEREPPNPAA